MHCYVYFEALQYFYNNTSMFRLNTFFYFSSLFYVIYLYVLFAILGFYIIEKMKYNCKKYIILLP